MSSTQINEPQPSSPSDPEVLRELHRYRVRVQKIAEAVEQRRCILFLGSGVHAHSSNPTYHYPKEGCPPFGDALSELLANTSHYPYRDPWNLPRVARYYEYQLGFRNLLIGEIKQIINKPDHSADDTSAFREPSPALRGLARLNFPIVITTNYDQLYERARDQVAAEEGFSAALTTSIYSPEETKRTTDCERDPAQSPYLLKIHGDINDDDSIVVTDEDYLQFVLRMRDKHPYHPVGKKLHSFLSNWQTLFIGYRLGDYNLRLLIKTLRWKMKRSQIPASYSVDLEPDVLIRDTMERDQYVSFIEKNLWDFVPDLYHSVKKKVMPP